MAQAHPAAEALELLRHRPEGTPCRSCGEALEALSSAVLDGLERQGLIALTEERVTRDPLAGRAVQTDFAPTLTAGRQRRYKASTPRLGGLRTAPLGIPGRRRGLSTG